MENQKITGKKSIGKSRKHNKKNRENSRERILSTKSRKPKKKSKDKVLKKKLRETKDFKR